MSAVTAQTSLLSGRRGKLIQIILAGQPELDRKLEAPEFRQLKQRIALRGTLRSFEPHETGEYIATRLAKAGMRQPAMNLPLRSMC